MFLRITIFQLFLCFLPIWVSTDVLESMQIQTNAKILNQKTIKNLNVKKGNKEIKN